MSGKFKLWFCLLTAFLAVQTGYSQVTATVHEGDLYGLGVVPVPGDTYEWHIFNDYTLSSECDSTEVIFPAGNIGSSVLVVWLKSGTWFFTVMVQNERGCSNLKVGLITVGALFVQGPSISIQMDRNPICTGTRVRFRATTLNQGLNSHFSWLKNGLSVGADSPVYADSTLAENDRIICILTTLPEKGHADPMHVQSNELVAIVYTTQAAFAIQEEGPESPGKIHLLNGSTGADEYDWDLGNGMSSFADNPEVTYYEDGIYLIRLVARKAGFCSDTTELRYRMTFKGLFIPNAFAPEASSSLPGVFKPAGIGLKYFKIEVYDNWGHMLWQSMSLDESGIPTESWDGTFNGRLMPQDTYMWKVEAKFTDGTIWTGSDIGKGPGRNMGTVTLIR